VPDGTDAFQTARLRFREASQAGESATSGPDQHPAEGSRTAANLQAAESLRQAYLETSDPAILGRALEASEVAVESASAEDFTARGMALGLRCVLLRMAYQRDKDPAKLAQAIEAGRTAKALFRPSDPGFPKTLNSLANALQEEYGRTRHSAILTEALALYREAVRVLPEGHAEIPGMYSNIGNVLMTQGIQDHNQQLFVEAVQAGREAVGMTDPEGPAFATRLANLGMALVAHYANCDGPPAELDEAERLFNEALATLPPTHALRPHIQNYLNGVSTLRLTH
jgi:tetratricopeptide (TPR) repeat protein